MAEQARLFCDVGLARRIEAAETELIAACARAARTRTGDGFVDRIGGGVASFTGADSPFTKLAGVGFGERPAPRLRPPLYPRHPGETPLTPTRGWPKRTIPRTGIMRSRMR